ncbi:MAG TPA: cation-binding protein, partial [Brevundimonas sp.]|nr:cation-binding protein [Brevundimonas sp.]
MDITQLILDDHAEQRRLFSLIEQIDAKEVEALEAVWGRLSAFLDAHAEAEEQHFYPALLKLGEGANDAEDGTVEGETEDAIEDHNKLRD